MINKNYLIVPYGLPGTGKSTYTEKLQEILQSGYFSPMNTRRSLGHKKYVKNKTSIVVGKTIHDALNSLRMKKLDTILESNFVRNKARENIYNTFGVWSHIIMIEFTCDHDIAKRRMTKRKKNDGLVVDSRDPKKYDELLKVYDTVSEDEIYIYNKVSFCKFESDTGTFTVIHTPIDDPNRDQMIEKIRATLVDTFTEFTTSQHKNNTTD